MARHPSVLILGYSEAAMLLKGTGAGSTQAVITIHGSREYPLDVEGVAHSLSLRFDDCEALDSTDPIQAARLRMRYREMAKVGLVMTPPTIEHARSIVEFARSISQVEGTLLCECQGGVSRSPAAALLCLAAWTEPGEEQDCVRQVRSVRPCASPHADLVRFGDTVLQRGGRLLAALNGTP